MPEPQSITTAAGGIRSCSEGFAVVTVTLGGGERRRQAQLGVSIQTPDHRSDVGLVTVGREIRGRSLATLVAGAAWAVVCLAAELTHASIPPAVGVSLCAALPIIGGLWLARESRRVGGDRRPVASLAMAVVLCGVIWIVRQISDVAPPWLQMVTIGGLYLTMLLHLAHGLVSIPGVRADGWETLRVVTDASLIGSLAAICSWRWLVMVPHVTLAPPLGFAVMSNALALGFCVMMISRQNGPLRNTGIWAATLAISDLLVVVSSQDGTPSWLLLGISCLAVGGIFSQLMLTDLVRTKVSLLREARLEARRLILGGTVTAVLVVADLASLNGGTGIDPVTWALIGVFVACTWGRETVRAQQALRHSIDLTDQAVCDPLTGLGNRLYLQQLLDDRVPTQTMEVGAITMDLDGFKDVNDLLGHTMGDMVLSSVAQAVAATVEGTQARGFRMGGDEFLILAYLGSEQTERLAHDLFTAVNRSVENLPALNRIRVSASIGMKHGLVAPDTRHAEVAYLLSASGEAMRAAKGMGKGRVLVHDDAMAQGRLRAIQIESRMRRLFSVGGGVAVHYQPLICVRTGTVRGVEALARWRDPELGPVSPAEFVQVAEETGLITQLGDQILRTALHDLSTSGFFDDGRHVAINVSPVQLRAPGYTARLLETLAELGVSRKSLVLEVTESVSVSSTGAALATLHELAAAGIGLAIDDFGAGYASIGYLQRLPVTVLKLDRSLTESLDDPRTDAIVRGVVAMAGGLELEVVLEGVETLEQAERARSLGIGFTQGWLYAAATPLADLTDVIADITRKHAGAMTAR